MNKEIAADHNGEVEVQMKKIGAKIREIRKSQEPNYMDWCVKNNMNKVSINRLERGGNVTLKLLITVMTKLGVSFQDLAKDI